MAAEHSLPVSYRRCYRATSVNLRFHRPSSFQSSARVRCHSSRTPTGPRETALNGDESTLIGLVGPRQILLSRCKAQPTTPVLCLQSSLPTATSCCLPETRRLVTGFHGRIASGPWTSEW